MIKPAVTAFFLAAEILVNAQQIGPTSPQIQEPPSGHIEPQTPSSIQVVREIDDPHTGDRWLLVRDLRQPGYPGQMILASDVPATSRRLEPGTEAPAAIPIAAPIPANSSALLRTTPVIHTGDRLVLEETTPMIDARLEAVALAPALAGASLRVRLVLGGRVLKALALGAGRVTFAMEGGFRP